MRRTLQIIIGVGGVAAVLIALLHIILGPATIPGSIPVNATMDSEDRFYATIFLAYGLALIWCVRDIETKRRVLWFLTITFFTGGIARIISALSVGLPHPFFINMTLLELSLPILIFILLRKLPNG
tara:strand:- start:1472 stop:1849 length:378 start_codon:yes stop_codon:yes gene_type:complete